MRDFFSRLQQSPFFKPPGLYASLGLLTVFLSSFAIDQVSKMQAQKQMLIWEDPTNTDLFQGAKKEISYLGQLDSTYIRLNLQYSRNKGAAFSMLADLNDRYRVPIFYLITLVASVLIFMYLKSTQIEQKFTRLGLVFVFSGAIGNFVDRLFEVTWLILSMLIGEFLAGNTTLRFSMLLTFVSILDSFV